MRDAIRAGEPLPVAEDAPAVERAWDDEAEEDEEEGRKRKKNRKKKR